MDTANLIESALAHHGIKGMKWGIRRKTDSTKTPTYSKAEAGHIVLTRDAHPTNVDHPIHPHDTFYHDGVTSNGSHFADYSTPAIHIGSKQVGYRKYSTGEKLIDLSDEQDTWTHYLTPGAKSLTPFEGDNGTPGSSNLKAYIMPKNAKHSDDFDVEEFLKHHGVKGMKWGVRNKSRTPESTSSPSSHTTKVQLGNAPGTAPAASVTIKSKHGHGIVGVSGGHKSPVTEDAAKTATSRQIAKKSSVDALTTPELKDLVNRMQLEQQYAKMTYKPTMGQLGKQWAIKVLSQAVTNVATSQLTNLGNNEVSKILTKSKGKHLPSNAGAISVADILKKNKK